MTARVVPPCRTTDPDLWFSEVLADRERAKALCRTCPLMDACAEWGRGEEYGVWAGLSAPERHRQERAA